MAGTKYPVILTSQIGEAIEEGAWIEVECVEAPERGGNTHRGGLIEPIPKQHAKQNGEKQPEERIAVDKPAFRPEVV